MPKNTTWGLNGAHPSGSSEREDDVPVLVEHFMRHFNALNGQHITDVSDQAMTCLRRYCYPGNIRELKNAIEHAFVLSETSEIELTDLPRRVRCDPDAEEGSEAPSATAGPLGIAEAEAIRETLRRHGGNRSAAADELGIARNTLWRKMNRYGLE